MTYREAIGHALTMKIGTSRVTGAPIYAVYGAEGEGDGGTDDAGDDDASDDADSGDDDSADSDDEDEDVKKASATAKERMKAADRRAAAAEKRAKELEAKQKELDDKDKSELERAQSRVTELESSLTTANDELKRARLQIAFLSVNEVTWHDPEDALGAIDLSEVEIDDKGKVNATQLKKAIKALAERKSHWVKTNEDSSTAASGSAMNGKRKGSDTQAADREALEKRLPALRNR
jgi:hypothetical protein